LNTTNKEKNQAELIARYKEWLKGSKNEGETYKWEAIKNFQQHWSFEEPGFEKMFVRAFRKRANLFYQNSWGFITKALKYSPEKVRKMFILLYDETKPIDQRIEFFKKDSENLLSNLKNELARDNINHQQDERTISVYLSLMYPEKYYLYKYSFYEAYCNLIGEEIASANNRYLHYIRLADDFKEQIVKKDTELLEMHKALNPDDGWADTNLIVQNILFTMLEQNLETDNLQWLKPLIEAFNKWYAGSGHLQNEDSYNDTLNLEYLNGLTKREFIQFFFDFARDGGGIQSKGYRTAPRFLDSLKADYNNKRRFLLKPFSDDFDVVSWLDQTSDFKGFGQGLATIYLNRIDKTRYCIVNNKSTQAFKKLGFELKGGLSRLFASIKDASTKLIEAFPSMENFYKTDSLTHYIIGEEEGRRIFEELFSEVNYWIFQGNPQIYNVVGSLQAGALKSWSVSAHKDKIKEGDKVILWVTGDASGCYALCRVSSKVRNRKDDEIEQKFYTDISKNESHDRVALEIELNLAESPLLKSDLFLLPEFTDFKGGNQGTNYTATKEQYDKIQELYWEMRLIETLTAISDRKKIEWFFDLLDEVVNNFDLINEDARISFTTPKHEKNRIAVTINQRYIIELSNTGSAIIPSTRIRLIGRQEDEELFRNQPGFIELNEFSTTSKKETPPFFAYYDNPTLLDNDELLDTWLHAIEDELERAEKSGFREHHNPMFFKAVTDSDYRNEILNKIFKPEPQMNNYPLNQIFFGPPGTGKTYNTINEAIRIADPNFYEANKEDRDQLKTRFRELLIKDWKNPQKGQISFCTFHQSFSYEDFIEGIKPVVKKQEEIIEEVSDLKYDIEDGIFKKLADRARYFASGEALKDKKRISLAEEDFKTAQFYKLSLGNFSIPEDDEIYKYCIQKSLISIGFMDDWDLAGITESELYNLAEKNKLSKYDPQAMAYFIHYLKKGNFVIISKGKDKARALGVVKGDYRYQNDSPIQYKHFRDVEWIITDADIPVEEIYQNAFSQKTIYKLNKDWVKKEFFVQSSAAPIKEEQPNFVLIIDEINRGNISQIFGELITLIEDDKRERKKEQLEAILPYSKEKFSVPANLYIIGTMNTADRSIEALDTALRRRFTFVEMAPKPWLIKDVGNSKGEIAGIDLVKLLETINLRIEKLIDKDHQIGHSYFLDIATLKEMKVAFKNKVVPLLEEYFYGDYGKIGLVLGDGFIAEKQKSDFSFADFKGFDEDIKTDLKERRIFEITDPESWSEEVFRKIYQK
jgi:hypothetical protein